jgi:hypothetical protein
MACGISNAVSLCFLVQTSPLFIPQGGKHSQGVFSGEPEEISGPVVSVDWKKIFVRDEKFKKIRTSRILAAVSGQNMLASNDWPLQGPGRAPEIQGQ